MTEVKKHFWGEVRASDGKMYVNRCKKTMADGSIRIYETWVTPEVFEEKRKKHSEYWKKPQNKIKKKLQSIKYYSKEQNRINKSIQQKKHHARNRERRLAEMKEYRNRPDKKELIKSGQDRYRKDPKNREKMLQYCREYGKDPKNKERRRILHRHKRKTNPQFLLSNRLRCRIKSALKSRNIKKHAKTLELIGCSYTFLKEHIEKQFKDGMSWNDFSTFHIDHIRPLASFDLSDPEQQKAACHWSNLQPLYPEENLRKGAKILTTK